MHYVSHLSKDKRLARVIKSQEVVSLEKRNDVWLRLCASIISQQLSTKVADVIFKRFLDLYPRKKPSLKAVLSTPMETLRSIGLSQSKAQYIQNVCSYFLEHKLTDQKLHAMSDQEVLETLLPIKGVGRWTVEMLLMFTMGYEDVFAVDDLGIQQAMIRLYGLETLDKKQLKSEMLRISAHWSPYRTYACKHLWRWKDNQ